MQDRKRIKVYLKNQSKLFNQSNFLLEAVILFISLMEIKKTFNKFSTQLYHITLHVLHDRKRN